MGRTLNSIRKLFAIPNTGSLRQMNLVSNEDASPDVNLKRDLCAVSKGNYASVLECDVDSSTGALPQIRSELIKESSSAPASTDKEAPQVYASSGVLPRADL